MLIRLDFTFLLYGVSHYCYTNTKQCCMCNETAKKKKKPKNPASTVKTRHASNNMHFPKVAKTVS